jgi:PPOX class probable F420-dependent enzyme
MTDEEAWRHLAESRSAVLATIAGDGSIDLVPIVFHADAPRLYLAVDDVKPKSTLRLGRLANIARDPRVTVLADRYDDDWAELWWVRVKGTATVITATPEADRALDRLAGAYPAYAERRPPGDVVRIDVAEVRGWSPAARPPPATERVGRRSGPVV